MDSIPLFPAIAPGVTRTAFSSGQNQGLTPLSLPYSIKQVVATGQATYVLTHSGTLLTNEDSSTEPGQGLGVEFAQMRHSVKFSKIFASSGCEHILVVDEEGVAYSFGANERGQLGQGNFQPLKVPKRIDYLTKKIVTSASCSKYHSLFVCGLDREVFASGRNDFGQLGIGCIDEHRNTPHPLQDFKGRPVAAVACGLLHSLVALQSGEVFAFGSNEEGQLGFSLPPGLQDTWVKKPTKIPNFRSVHVKCGDLHSAALVSGRLYCWGSNEQGQLGNGRFSQKQASPQQVATDSEFKMIACGAFHTVGLTHGNKVLAFGQNEQGQLGDGSTTNSCVPLEIPPPLPDEALDRRAHGDLDELGKQILSIKNQFKWSEKTETRSSSSSFSFLEEDCFEEPEENESEGKEEVSESHHLKIETLWEQQTSQFDRYLTQGEKEKERVVEPIGLSAGSHHTVILANIHTEDKLLLQLRTLLKTAQDSGSGADVRFVVRNQSIWGHKFVLMARSEVFRHMVAGPMQGGEENEFNRTVVIGNEVSPEAFLLLLEFMYTDDVANLVQRIEKDIQVGLDLICLSEQYLIQRLKYLAEAALVTSGQITLGNVCRLVMIATVQSAFLLRRKCLEFMVVHFQEIIIQEDFLTKLDKATFRELMVLANRNLKFELDAYDF